MISRGRLRGAWIGLLAAMATACLAQEDWPTVKLGIRTRYPDVEQIQPADLAAWQAQTDSTQPILLDVRQPAEYAISHLTGARRSLDLEDALQVLADAPADTPIVLYCSVGYRSSGLAQLLRQRGYTRTVNLEGSIFQWANEGRPLVDADDQPTPWVHPYGRPWSGLLDSTRRAE